jgi:hypothetical protein
MTAQEEDQHDICKQKIYSQQRRPLRPFKATSWRIHGIGGHAVLLPSPCLQRQLHLYFGLWERGPWRFIVEMCGLTFWNGTEVYESMFFCLKLLVLMYRKWSSKLLDSTERLPPKENSRQRGAQKGTWLPRNPWSIKTTQSPVFSSTLVVNSKFERKHPTRRPPACGWTL